MEEEEEELDDNMVRRVEGMECVFSKRLSPTENSSNVNPAETEREEEGEEEAAKDDAAN